MIGPGAQGGGPTWWAELSWLERRVVVPEVGGSKPLGHPSADPAAANVTPQPVPPTPRATLRRVARARTRSRSARARAGARVVRARATRRRARRRTPP